ncbi:MAG: hypothetical protein HQ558_06310 [Candidatus Omnitrophica bacterium]|nr:hypothetical protein [Candidatus Omnitrophota bacterium]
MKTIMVLLIFVSLLIFAGQAYCEDGDSQSRFLFFQADSDYGKGDFEEAIAGYEKILTLGLESGPLYYNLGNAYFKYGSLGKAILNYLRAQTLMPEDADLLSNLAYARSKIKGGMISQKRNWFKGIFLDMAASLGLDKLTRYTTTLYFIFSGLLILIILAARFRRPLIYISLPILVLLILSASLFAVEFDKILIQKGAVIIAEMADSKFEPFDDATTFFTLREGESVVIVATKNGWAKVRRVDGKQGWIPRPSMELL